MKIHIIKQSWTLAKLKSPAQRAVVILLYSAVGARGAETVPLQGSWWAEPAAQTRHTSFMATFDSPTSNDADFARGNGGAGGGGMNPDAPGKFGKATRIDTPGGHLHFQAAHNFNPEVGTLRMLIKGEVWKDKTPRWLFEARAGIRLGIRRDAKNLSLILNEIHRFEAPVPIKEPDPIAKLDLPLDDVSTNDWHCVVASWDRAKGLGWIALDGRCVSGPLRFPAPAEPALAFYIGGGYEARRRGRNEPGLSYDEVVIYDQSIQQMEAPGQSLPEEERNLLPKAEAAARQCLKFIAGLQYGGGWPRSLTWPTLFWCGGAREYIDPPGAINAEIGGTADIAAQFMYAHQILGDYPWKETALRSADFLVYVQDPLGYWQQSYDANGYSVKSIDDQRHIKLQDCVQYRPLFFLAYIHRLTGEPRYLPAIKRAGEFMLMAQNPNGSWSHHWDAVARVGRTEPLGGNFPGGGELNDFATNNAIDSMVLLYHLTGDRRYLEAVKRVGQWLIEAQLRGPVRGWADQYDQNNNPVWAREFEPRSCSSRATTLACTALVEIYRLSGDARYLQPVRDCLAWLEKTYPDGKMYLFHDVETGRPIAAWEFKQIFLDDPEQLAWYRQQARGNSYSMSYSITPEIRKLIDHAARPSERIPQATLKSTANLIAELRPRVQQLLKTQNEAGVWVYAGFDAMSKFKPGANISAGVPMELLRYIEAARMVMGELPTAWRGDGELERLAYLKSDWYNVPW